LFSPPAYAFNPSQEVLTIAAVGDLMLAVERSRSEEFGPLSLAEVMPFLERPM
jgi:hypothetical protein